MAPKTPKGQTRNLIFVFVKDRLLGGMPPTVRDVQKAFSFKSVQTAREHLENLVREGRLVKQPGVSRGYRLPDIIDNFETGSFINVPVLGSVQAGNLMLAVEESNGYIAVQSSFANEELFALNVKGYSMQNAGILPGDIVIVKKQSSADNDDIVVALIDDEATVKRLRFNNGFPELHPENDDFSPIIIDPECQFYILGKVIEVRRQYS